MKKHLLNFACLLLTLSSYSQTNSDASGNDINSDATGYTFEYNKSDNPSFQSESINCLDTWLHGGSGGTFSYDEAAESAVYLTNGTKQNIRVLFTIDNCSTLASTRGTGLDGIDVSDPSNQQIQLCIYATASANLIIDGIYGNEGLTGSKYDNNGVIDWNRSIELIEGANSVTVSELFPTHDSNDDDLAAMSNGVNGLFGLDFYFRDSNRENVALPSTSFYINHLGIGSGHGGCPAFPLITDLRKDQEENAFEIFPNPTQGDELSFSKELNNIIITSTTGTVVLASTKASKIDISSLEKGIYIIKANEGTSKLIIE